MAANEPDSKPLEGNVPTPIEPREAAAAVKEVHEAMAILPRKRLGCLGRFAKYRAVLLVLLALFVYWNFLRTPRLRISKETTYITQPLTSDGTLVDYFAALEQEVYPPEMQTDDNGYRLIVRPLGAAPDGRGENETSGAAEGRAAQIYEKLGLDPAIGPTMSYVEPDDFLQQYSTDEGLDEKQAYDLGDKVGEPWTLDDLPMMGPWLEKNGPAIDLVGEAVRKGTFCIPLVRRQEGVILDETMALGEMLRTRSFARMIHARANYRIAGGDIDGAVYDVISCKRLGRHMQYQGALVARLVGIAVEGIADSLGVAAIRDAQPTEAQLQRFVAQLNALPQRPDFDRTKLAERYYTLDLLQAVAHGYRSPEVLFPDSRHMGEFWHGIAVHVPVDWNIVMRRINAQYDELDKMDALQSPNLLSLGSLFIGTRSWRVADLISCMAMATFQATREADHRSRCTENLDRITLAMLMYQHQHGTLPAAYSVDAAGKPLHSWRVLLLPYLGQQELCDKLRLDEPWDSEHNRQFHDAAPAIYQCPSALLQSSQTNYSVVVGEKTAFGADAGKSLDDFSMHLILVVEREQPVCWMDPARELTASIALQGINRREANADGIGSPHPFGLNVGLRNGSARFITESIAPLLLQGLLEGTAEEFGY